MRVESVNDTTLGLPYWDDFSQLDTTGRPLPLYWADRGGVTVNNDWAIAQPTRNVAVLDGTDANGIVYSGYLFTNGIGDSLISRQIKLSDYKTTDNVVLSFYYQCGGKAEAPDSAQGDYLQLSIKGKTSNKDTLNTSGSVWYPIWKQTGCGGRNISQNNQNQFVYVAIPLDSSKYMVDNFQFEFQNYGRLSGAFDVWMVDYIYLNKGRKDSPPLNPKDQYQSDRAANSVANLFSKYTAIPYKHFYEVGPSNFVTSNLDSYVSNLSTGLNPVQGKIEITNSKTGLLTPVFPFSGTDVPKKELNYKIVTALPTSLNFVSTDEPQVIQTKLYIEDIFQDSTANDLGFPYGTFYKNDTVVSVSYLDSCYAYDDGVPEYSAAVGARGAKMAYKYEIPVQNAIITGVRIYFSKNLKDIAGTAFTPYVWRTLDKKGVGRYDEVLYPAAGNEDTALTSVSYPNGLPGFTDYHFRTLTPIVVSDSFYVGYIQNDYQNLQIGFDYNQERSTANGLFSNAGNGWLQFNEAPGNLMIRPIFGTFATPTTRVDEEGVSDIYLGPSPTTGVVQVLNEEIQEFKVNDVTGRRVDGVLIKDKTGDKLDLSSANDGLYIVQLKVRGTWFNKKVIVIK